MGISWRKIRIAFVLLVGFGILSQQASAQQNQLSAYNEQLVEVQDLVKVGDVSRAVERLDQLTENYPDMPEAYYLKSLLLSRGGLYDMALPSAETAFELEPDNLAYANHLVSIYKEQRDLSSALVVINKVKGIYPSMVRLYTEEMLLLTANGQPDAATDVYTDAVARFGSSDTLDILYAEILLNTGEFNKAGEVLTPYREKQSSIPQVYGLLSNAYSGKGDRKAATAVLEEGLRMTNSSLLYLDLADVYLSDNDNKKAVNVLKNAFEAEDVDYTEKLRVMTQVVDPNSGIPLSDKKELVDVLMFEYPKSPDIHSLKGDVSWQAGDLDEAHILYLRAVEIFPQHVDSWRKAMSVKMEQNDVDRAITLGMEGVAKNPNNPVLYYFTGVAYFLKDDHPNARTFLESALNNSENENDFVRSMIYSSLGDLYYAMDMVDVSDVAYEEAIALDDTNASALNNLAYYLALRKKDLDRAEEYAARAVALDPSSGTFQDTYAWVLFQQENYDKAQIWIEKAIKNSAPSAVLYEHYGDILIQQGKNRAAVKQWQRAINLAPGDKSVNVDRINEKISEKKYID